MLTDGSASAVLAAIFSLAVCTYVRPLILFAVGLLLSMLRDAVDLRTRGERRPVGRLMGKLMGRSEADWVLAITEQSKEHFRLAPTT